MRTTRRELLAGAAALGTLRVAQPEYAAAAGPPKLPARGEFVVRNAYVITMDPKLGDIPNGDVHVRNGQIVAIGKNLSAPGAATIDAKTMIVIPGLIETHWHMWGTAARNLAGDDPKTGYF